MKFLDREKDVERLLAALNREKTQFIVLYGRRRIGKSTLLKKVLDFERGDIYYLADSTSETNQRKLLSGMVEGSVVGFDSVEYPSWESLLRSLNRQIEKRITLCFDEFPNLVKSCPSLPSVIQKLLDEKTLKFDLIICGSSQQLMQGYVLDGREPLYGRADEIVKLKPIPPRYVCEAFSCDERQAVEEYSVWGGTPRYWELRSEYPDMRTAIMNLMLTARGFLIEEPQRLLRDDMRDTVQTSTILTAIGNGINRMSEIAARAGKDAPHITEPLAKLRELGYVRRDIPYGEDEKKSKRGLYKIGDPFLAFYYRFIVPNRSYIEMERDSVVMNIIDVHLNEHVGECWEQMCRNYVSGNIIDGVLYQMAYRWWGKVKIDEKKEAEQVELDVVAESFDKNHILIGECKWTAKENADRLINRLEKIASALPFIKGHKVHYFLFLRDETVQPCAGKVLYPSDVLGA